MASSSRTRLGGWKAIAAYLQRDERTVMRWATQRGMPVHRVPGQGRASVYASTEALDAWLRSGGEQVPPTAVDARPAPPAPAVPAAAPRAGRVHPGWLVAGLAVLLLAIVATVPAGRPAAAPRVPTAAPADPVTRELLLSAAYDWNRRTQASLWRATREYSAAIGRDPRRPDAFIGLANTYLLLREYGSLPDREAYPRAEAAAEAALALAPGAAEAHRVLGFVAFWWHGDRPAARRAFERALALGPGDPLTHHWFATALLADGEPAAALREINRAWELDPTSASIRVDRGLIAYSAGERTLGLATLTGLLPEQADDVSLHRALAAIALWEGRTRDYLREAIVMDHLRDDAEDEAALRALAASPDARAPGWLLPRLVARARLAAERSGTGYFALAQYLSLAGNGAEADHALARACGMREAITISARGDLWLSRSLSRERIATLCGRAAL